METALFVPEAPAGTSPLPKPDTKTARIVGQTTLRAVGAERRLKQVGVAVVVATLVAYFIASLERQIVLGAKKDRETLESNAKSTGATAEILDRFKIRRITEAGRSQLENTVQNIAWAAEDERERDRRDAAKKEQQRVELAAIERTYDRHFALIWLVTTGVLLARGSSMVSRGPRE